MTLPRHDYYALVGRLDEAIDQAISNSYLVQAMRSLRVRLVSVRRLAADDAARINAAAAEHAAIAEALGQNSSGQKIHSMMSSRRVL